MKEHLQLFQFIGIGFGVILVGILFWIGVFQAAVWLWHAWVAR